MINQNAGTRTDEGAVRQAIADYLERGWNVIPLRGENKKPAFGKDELRPHLYQRPDRETVREWYGEGRFGGVGVVTGPTSGIVVLDVDGEEGKALLKKHGHAPTPTVSTSKGLHLYFKDPGGNMSTSIRFAPDLDLKARGGYVAAPPTAGREWIIHPGECELADLPEWVIERIRLRGSRAKFEWGGDIPNGERNKRLTSLAGKLRYAGLDARSILSTLAVENQARCKPPLKDDEVRKIAESASRYEVGSFSSFHFPLGVPSDDENNEGAEIVWFAELGEPKEREYLIEKIGVKGYPIVAFGAGGVAKSFAMLAAGIAIASASGVDEWLGLRILEHGFVLYLDFELDVDEQHRRVRDLCAGMGIPTPKKLAYLSGVGVTPDKAFMQAMAFVEKYEAKAVIIDSMGLAMQGDMEKGKEVLAFHSRYINPLRRAGATPFIVDHEGKLQAGEKHKDKSPFGSAYKAWASRSVLQFQFEEYREETSELDIRVRQTKTNFGPKVEPIGLRFTFEEKKVSMGTYDLPDEELLEEESKPVGERIYAALQIEPATVADLARMTGAAQGTIYNNLSRMMKAEPPLVEEAGYKGRSKLYSLFSSSPEHPRESETMKTKEGGYEEDFG